MSWGTPPPGAAQADPLPTRGLPIAHRVAVLEWSQDRERRRCGAHAGGRPLADQGTLAPRPRDRHSQAVPTWPRLGRQTSWVRSTFLSELPYRLVPHGSTDAVPMMGKSWAALKCFLRVVASPG